MAYENSPTRAKLKGWSLYVAKQQDEGLFVLHYGSFIEYIDKGLEVDYTGPALMQLTDDSGNAQDLRFIPCKVVKIGKKYRLMGSAFWTYMQRKMEVIHAT